MDEDTNKDEIVFEDEEETANPQAVIKKLRERLKGTEAKAQEYLTGGKKERADLVNARKRDEEEKREFAKFAKEDIATELISVLDSFDSAFKNKEAWEKVDENWRKGVEYIHAQLINVLANHGVSIISPLGEKFDPQRDEAVENVPTRDKKEDDKI